MDKGLDIVMLRTFLACHAAAYFHSKFPLETLAGPGDLESRAAAALYWLKARRIEPGWEAADKACEWLASPGHHLVVAGQTDYPSLLAASAAAPPLLFVDGDPRGLGLP